MVPEFQVPIVPLSVGVTRAKRDRRDLLRRTAEVSDAADLRRTHSLLAVVGGRILHDDSV
jgi:hypothetical protein